MCKKILVTKPNIKRQDEAFDDDVMMTMMMTHAHTTKKKSSSLPLSLDGLVLQIDRHPAIASHQIQSQKSELHLNVPSSFFNPLTNS